MKKMSRFWAATIAAATYFIIFVVLKYSPQDKIWDWENGLIGAAAFWIVIFLVLQSLIKRTGS
jgi:hypothetical protein